MTCNDARTALLTASRDELRGEGRSEVAAHVRGCRTCAVAALRMNAGTEMLAEMVRARGVAPVQRRPVRVRGAVMALLPIAAALAFVLVRAPTGEPPATSNVVSANGVSLQTMTGQTATVIPTQDPKVTIIWISGDSE